MEGILAIHSQLMISKSEVVLYNLISLRLAYFMFTIQYSKLKPQQNSETLRSENFNFIVNLRQENLSRRISQKACNTLLTRRGGSTLERQQQILSLLG